MKTGEICVALALWVCAAAGCHHETVRSGWIQGDSGQRWQTVEKQLRGLDVAMMEIGYRYEELYWAGVDSNWEYADYQLTKIRLSLENALDRRPKRRASSEEKFFPSLDEMKRAADTRKRAAFEEAFGRLTASCNSCHVAEGVASFHVEPPSVRRSAIRAPR
jgi:CRISPR/Cas system CSM-associated protein Csm2 small subunit